MSFSLSENKKLFADGGVPKEKKHVKGGGKNYLQILVFQWEKHVKGGCLLYAGYLQIL